MIPKLFKIKPLPYPVDFMRFWDLFPGRTNRKGRIIKNDKEGALEKWRQLTHEEKEAAILGAPKVLQGEYTEDARKYLKRKHWQNEDVTDRPENKDKCVICGSEDVRASQDGKGWRCWREDCINRFERM